MLLIASICMLIDVIDPNTLLMHNILVLHDGSDGANFFSILDGKGKLGLYLSMTDGVQLKVRIMAFKCPCSFLAITCDF